MKIEQMLKELQELKAEALENRRESDMHDSYYEGINQALEIVKNCSIDVVVKSFICRDCEKHSKEYRDNLCEPCHKWHTDS